MWVLRGMWLLQMRYAAGTKDVLDRFFNNKPLKKDDVIVEVSHLLCLPHRLCCCCCCSMLLLVVFKPVGNLHVALCSCLSCGPVKCNVCLFGLFEVCMHPMSASLLSCMC